MKLTKRGIGWGPLNPIIVSTQKKTKRFKSAKHLISTIKAWDSVDIVGLADTQLTNHVTVLVSHLNWALREWGWQKRKTYLTLHRVLTAAENQLAVLWTEIMVRRQHLDNLYGLADSIERLEWAFKQQKDIFEAKRIVITSAVTSSTISFNAVYATGTTT